MLIPSSAVQAVVTLRDAAVREWVTTSKHDQRALRGYVLHHILRHFFLSFFLSVCLSFFLSFFLSLY